MQAVLFLIDTAFSLYLMVVILRLWLQLARADFYNPFSQFVVKATNPLVLPLRRLIPSIGSLDSATLVLAYGIMLAKMLLMQLLGQGQVALGASLIFAAVLLVKEILTLLFWPGQKPGRAGDASTDRAGIASGQAYYSTHWRVGLVGIGGTGWPAVFKYSVY